MTPKPPHALQLAVDTLRRKAANIGAQTALLADAEDEVRAIGVGDLDCFHAELFYESADRVEVVV